MTQDDNGVVQWDVAALLAAEQALEFRVHQAKYYNNQCYQRGGQDGWDHHWGDGVRQRDGKHLTIKVDAGMALRLVTALHHFHLLLLIKDAKTTTMITMMGENELAVLPNGMYLHIVCQEPKCQTCRHGGRTAKAVIDVFKEK